MSAPGHQESLSASTPHADDVVIWRLYPSGDFTVAVGREPDHRFSQSEWCAAFAYAQRRSVAAGRRLWFCDQRGDPVPYLVGT